ncbi:MAG: hypothetical protein H6Q86_3966, partial [candidate division NC10 bacterium]|nr:hypothetical protein [candidate division NC10 bacterium]
MTICDDANDSTKIPTNLSHTPALADELSARQRCLVVVGPEPASPADRIETGAVSR